MKLGFSIILPLIAQQHPSSTEGEPVTTKPRPPAGRANQKKLPEFLDLLQKLISKSFLTTNLRKQELRLRSILRIFLPGFP
jgi:hypothetical protein